MLDGKSLYGLLTTRGARLGDVANNKAPIVTVIGKAFFDLGHAPKDQSNRRSHRPGYAAYEIHPVMKIDVQ